MNIIREYSLDQVRKNRRTSISIMVAVLIASTFLCALLVFAQSFWNQMVQQEIYIGGDWDAELMDVPAWSEPGCRHARCVDKTRRRNNLS